MDLEKFSLLESKISQLIECLTALKEGKRQLEDRVRSLETELQGQKDEAVKFKEDALSLESLKEENRTLHEGQTAARSSLETILQKLEGIDFS